MIAAEGNLCPRCAQLRPALDEAHAGLKDAAEEIERLRARVAELEQMLSAAWQVINGTATITDRFSDSGTPRVDVRELIAKLGMARIAD